MNGYQRERSEYERNMPDYQRDALDRARMLRDPMTNTKITQKEAAAYVNSWLPPGDPGRIEDKTGEWS